MIGRIELTLPVLLVDDTASTRYVTRRMLMAAGAEVIEAVTGQAALQMAAGCGAVILDVNLPDMDGFEVCRALRGDPRTQHLPVIHLSAQHLQDADKAIGLDSGGDAYLTHPVDSGVLTATINSLLRARRAELTADSARLRFEAIFRAAPVGMAVMTRDGVVTDCNPEFGRVFGRECDELSHMPAEHLPPAIRSAHARAVAALDGGEEAAHWSVATSHPDHARRAQHLGWHLATAGDDALVMMVVDDTAKRELEIERERLHAREVQARAEAEDANRAKDTFLAMLSHELRNPLNTLSMWIGFLRRSVGESRLQEGLDSIARSVALQARLVGDLLDVSRINTGKLTLATERVAPVRVIGDVLMSLQEDADARGVGLRRALDPELEITADPARLHQIVWNLVSNAIKFSRAGGHVEVRLQREGDDAVLTVLDTGSGIAADFLPFVFDRFTQGSRVAAQAGLGLGLSIVKSLVEMQGGSIAVQSAGADLGSCFRVRFPVDGPVALFHLGRDDAGALLAGHTILIVDDSEEMRRMLALVLSQHGATVMQAASAEEALAALEGSVPSLLLSDIGLPGLDGYSFLRALRASTRAGQGVPAIAVTAYARDDDLDRAREAGFRAHIAKPVDMRILLEAIQASIA